MPQAARLLALTCALTAAVVAGGTEAGASTVERPVISVHASSTEKVLATSLTQPGLAEIRNTGNAGIFLVAPLHGATPAALARDLNAATPGGLITDFLVADALPGDVTTYVRLKPGDYYLADMDSDGFRASAIATLRVTGSVLNATAPKAQSVTTTSKDVLSAPSTVPSHSELKITNDSSELQELLEAPVGKSVSARTLQKFLAKPSLEDLGTLISGAPSSLAMLSPTLTATSSHHDSAGRYLFFEFGFTAHTSEPKLTAGQVRLVTVT